MNLSNVTFFVVLSLSVSNVIGYAQTFPETLTLDEAITLAIDTDPWLTGSQYTQQALNDEATAAATLPDPRMSLMAGNFPVDSFDINQEAMTQLSVGISQMFPRGDSLSLTRRQKQQLAEQHPLLRLDRRARLGATVSQLWLE
ncbi:TolC family protein, partial [Rheinheimera sp.]